MSAGSLIGAAIGAFFGPTGAQYGWTLGGIADSVLNPPKGPNSVGPRLSDLSVQTSTYGAYIPRAYGTVPLHGNVFWLENNALRETVTVTRASSGGKGGGKKKAKQTTYSYSGTFAVGLCEGPITGVRRIWVGSRLVYDAGATSIEELGASNDATSNFRIYLGTDTQEPDPRMQASLGVANTPAYRGLAYIVFYDYELSGHGNSLVGAPVKVEVVNAGSSAPISFANAASLPLPSGSTGTGPGGYAWRSDGGVQMVRVHVPSGTVVVRRSVYASSGHAILPVGYDTTGEMLCTRITAYGMLILKPNGQIDEFFSATAPSTSADQAWGVNGIWAVLAGNHLNRYKRDGTYAQANAPVSTTFFSKVVSGNVLDGWIYFTYTTATATLLGRYDPVSDVWEDLFAFGATYTVPIVGRDGYFYLYNAGPIVKMDSTGTVVATSANGVGVPAYYTNADTVIGYVAGTTTWTVLRASDLTTIGSVVSAAGTPQPDFFNSDAMCSGRSTIFSVPGVTIANPTLADVVETEALASGLLGAGDIDVTSLTDEVRGYTVGSLTSLRSVLEPLQAAFPFDVVQSGYTLAFIRRGLASVATITSGELDARPAGSAPGVSISVAREMDLVLPRRVAVKYLDHAREFDPGEQYAERLNTDAVNTKAIELPLVLTATEAAGIAESLLYLYWQDRSDFKLALPAAYNHLEPADIVTVQADAGDYEIRLTSVTYTADGRLECDGKANRAAVYTPAAIGEEGAATGGMATLSGDSVFVPMDIPALSTAHNVPGYLAAMAGITGGWDGGTLFRTDDAGQNWTDVQAFTEPASVVGYASTTLPTYRTDIFDKTNRLTAFFNGDLVSVSELDVLNGANHFAYGVHGRWEIIGVQNCVQQVDESWILSDILRGRAGTEWATGLHAVNDAVVLIDLAAQNFIAMSLDSIGLERTYRAVSNDQLVSAVLDQAFTYDGQNLECYSPVYLNGNRHPSTNDWTLTWIRRTRIGGDWRAYVDATLGETTESYEIDIYSDGTYATLKRTLTATAQTVAYTSAQQVTDFGSNQATLYVKVYQLSETVGRGQPLTTSITR